MRYNSSWTETWFGTQPPRLARLVGTVHVPFPKLTSLAHPTWAVPAAFATTHFVHDAVAGSKILVRVEQLEVGPHEDVQPQGDTDRKHSEAHDTHANHHCPASTRLHLNGDGVWSAGSDGACPAGV